MGNWEWRVRWTPGLAYLATIALIDRITTLDAPESRSIITLARLGVDPLHAIAQTPWRVRGQRRGDGPVAGGGASIKLHTAAGCVDDLGALGAGRSEDPLHTWAELSAAAGGVQGVVQIPHVADDEGGLRRMPNLGLHGRRRVARLPRLRLHDELGTRGEGRRLHGAWQEVRAHDSEPAGGGRVHGEWRWAGVHGPAPGKSDSVGFSYVS